MAPTFYWKQHWKRRWLEIRSFYSEQELYVAPLLCDRNKTSIDIGASEGIYTFHMLEASRDCFSFEPRQPAALKMAEMAKCLSLPVRVEAVALSDEMGEAILRVFEVWEGRATVEIENPLEDCDSSKIYEVIVRTRRLDDYDLVPSCISQRT